MLREVNLFSGSTILGDGSAVIILDTGRIAAKGGLLQEESRAAAAESAGVKAAGDRISLLIAKAGRPAPVAVPLALVSRLEEFARDRVERVGGKLVVQYRGELVPLAVPGGASAESLTAADRIPALIFSDGQRTMGLLVEEILDIVDCECVIERSAGNPELLGAAIVGGAATEILDVYHFLRVAYPDWFGKEGTPSEGRAARLLVVDDPSFFRGLLKPLLESRGYEVALAEDGLAALEQLEAGGEFDLVLSDIEMPRLDGLGLVRRLRSEPRWAGLPVLALTTLAGEGSRRAGLEAGFRDYLVKFDQDLVLAAIARAIAAPALAKEAAV